MSYRAPIEGLDDAAQLEIGRAIERENHVRESAYIDAPSFVCGLPVLPLTPRRYLLLEAIDSPFVKGGLLPDESDVVLMLWILSPRFNGKRGFWRWLHIRRCRKVVFMEALTALDRIVRDTFQDAPGGKAGIGFIPKTSWLTDLVDLLASEYHWRESDILDTPLARIFGYLKRIRLRNDPQAVTFNPSDRVICEVVARQNQVRHAE